MSFALGLLGAAVLGAGQQPPAWPPCDPAAAPAMTLVAPATLPVRYDGGFYLELAGPGYPDGRDLNTQEPVTVTVSPATAAPISHGYTAGPERIDAGDRWPLRFEAGDGPARIGIRYTESLPGVQYCIREFSAVVVPTPIEDAAVRLSRPRVRWRLVDVDGIARYSGDVAETWPCDDIFSTGATDECHDRLAAPQGVRRTTS